MPFLLQQLRRLRRDWTRFRHHREGYSQVVYEEAPNEAYGDAERELLWAKHLTDDLYRLENVPLIQELALHDVVRCEQRPDELPRIVQVVRRSGNRTLRVKFRPEIPAESMHRVTSQLLAHHIFAEKVGPTQFLYNVEPSDDYEWMEHYLKSKQDEGLLWIYE